jgi:putative lipoic acid-binding regulatory protein
MANKTPQLKIIGQDESQKLELDYPCSWKYKIIGEERKKLEEAVHSVILERAHTLKHSNASKTGKYISMNLDLIVQNEDERTFIYEALKAHQHIKMVL